MDVKSYKPYIILILLVTLAYACSLRNSFVWDDYGLIVDNPGIDLPAGEMHSVFIKPLWKMAGFGEYKQVYYRPMVSLFFVVNFKIWGLNPSGFHITNLMLHLIGAVLLYKAGIILVENKNASLLGASLFAVHPAHNEPLGRAASGEVIFGFFIILCIYLFLKERRYLSWTVFFLALLSKEAAVMLPAGLLILSVHKKGARKGILEIIPYAALTGIYLILRMLLADTVLGDDIAQPALTRLLTMSAAAFDYIRLLIVPFPLSPFYQARWYASPAGLKVIPSLILLLAVVILAVRLRKDRVMLFLLLWPLLFLAPVIWRVNTFPAGQDLAYINERFLYVPAMFFMLFLSVAALKSAGGKKERIVFAGGAVIAFFFILISIYSGMIWRNNITLFGNIVRRSPDAGFAHYGLANAYKEQGMMNEALLEWQKSVDLNPGNSKAWNSIGNIYVLRGDFEKAIYPYRMAIETEPKNIEAYYNLGLALEKTGRNNEALTYYTGFIRLAPESYGDTVEELKKKLHTLK